MTTQAVPWIGPPIAVEVHEDTAAEVLVKHLFAQPNDTILGVEYALGFWPADGPTGGDIIDVFSFQNGSVAFTIADISGKGVRAAVHAALIKYALRAYLSDGQTPERALRSLNRLVMENNTFEDTDAFASVFLGVIDATRKTMMYASGGHEPVVLHRPGLGAQILPPTAPLIGVFGTEGQIFGQDIAVLEYGSILVAATDGVTEARNPTSLYGMERFVDQISGHAKEPLRDQVNALLADVMQHCEGKPQDDIAILVARIL